jgi:PAS domain S-box-containing protein
MVDFLREALTAGPFLPHGHCYLWEPALVWLHVGSDAAIALAYYAMPAMLIYVGRRRRDLPFNWMFVMFGAFIVACGTTHVMGVWNLWYAHYWLAGAIKLATAAVSSATAVLLWPLVPKALALPSPTQLEAINRALQEEIRDRQQVEAELRHARHELERRVEERTVALAQANAILQGEVAERQRIEAALRASEAHFRLAVDSAPNAVVLVDQAGKIVLVNAQTERYFGYRRDELLGQPLEILVPERYRRRHAAERRGFFASPQARPMGAGRELYGLRKDGSEFPVEIGLTPIDTAEGTLVLSAIVDLTARRQAEEALHKAVVDAMQHAAQLRGLSEAALALNSARSIAEVLQMAAEQARAIVGAHQATVWLASQPEVGDSGHAVSLSDTYAAWRGQPRPPEISAIHALVSGENRLIRLSQAELEAHPAWREAVAAEPHQPALRGCLAAPLIGRDGGTLGFVMLCDKQDGEFTETDESIIAQLAHMAAVALENRRLLSQVQAREEQLRHQLELTRAIADSLGEGVYAVDRQGRLTFVNPAARELLGWTEAELLGRISHAVTHGRPADAATPRLAEDCTLVAVMRGQADLVRGEDVFIRRDGTAFPVAYASSPIEVDGEIVGAVVAFHDITERRRAEEALRRQSLLFANITDGVMILDPQRRIVDWNAAAERIFGYTKAEVVGQTPALLHSPADAPRLAQEINAGLAREGRWSGEIRFIRKDGTTGICETVVVPVYDERGALVARIGVNRDITERKRTEEALREAKVLLEKIFASLDEAVLLIDASSRTILTCNPAVERVFGYRPEEMIGRNTAFLYPDEEAYRAFGQQLREALPARGVHRAELWMRRKDGQLFMGEATVSALVDEAGRRDITVWRDITARKQAEAQIRQLNAELERRVIERTAQLEAANRELETFSYSVSHDLRAPLRSIDGFSQALLEDCAAQLDAQGRDYLQRIRGATQRMAELIEALLGLSRVTRAGLQRHEVDLSAMARAIAAELQRTDPSRHVEFAIADGLIVSGDARLLRVAMENLLGNAWKFTAKQPRARIEFGMQRQDDGTCAFFVRDNGAGFDMAYAEKLFGAFQRLHRASEFHGTGIGLATVQRIVHRHGGRIWAEGAVGQGATFYFTL